MARAKKNVNGEGTKTRKRADGRYETRAVLDTPTGRRRVSFYGKTAKEANDQKIEVIAKQNKGILFSDPGTLTIAEHIENWLSDTARYQVSPGTYSHYRRTCANHLLPFLGKLKLRNIAASHVRALKARKLDEVLHPNTVGRIQSVLGTVLNQAANDGLTSQNPAALVKKAASRGQRPMSALSHEDASSLMAAAAGTRDEALIVVTLRTGMRQGELAALRREDVALSSPNRSSIRVHRSADTRTRTIVPSTKTGEERVVGIGPHTVAVLKAHPQRQRH